jgi:hypothetical protein
VDSIVRELQRIAKLVSAGHFTKERVCKDMRVKWDDHYGIQMEELPAKGKKRLRILGFGIQRVVSEADPYFNIPNVIDDMKLSSSQTYDKAKKAIENFCKEHFDDIEKRTGKDMSGWIILHEDTVHYLKVEPVGVKKQLIDGKDFTVSSEWSKFSSYSPDSDFQSSDPSYIQYESSSAAAARKLYKILNANPDALKNVTWNDFGKWMDRNKIKYDTNFSVWR